VALWPYYIEGPNICDCNLKPCKLHVNMWPACPFQLEFPKNVAHIWIAAKFGIMPWPFQGSLLLNDCMYL
jgi:hypothetical protein